MVNTIDILNSINITVKEIAKTMSLQNGSGKETVAKLSKGEVTPVAASNPAQNSAKSNISITNIGEVVSMLNKLSPSVISISKLSGSKIKSFDDVLKQIVNSINKLSECAKANKDIVKETKVLIESFDLLVKTIGNSSGLVVKAPLATLGLKLANGTVKAMMEILKTASKISSVGDKVKKLNSMTKAMDPLMKLTMKAILLVGLLMGLGLILMLGPTKKLILGGLMALGAVTLVMIVLILLTGVAGLLIKTTNTFGAMRQMMALMFASVLLVGLCFALGFLIDSLGGWKSLAYGLIAVAATMILFLGIMWVAGIVANVAKDPNTMQSLAIIFGLAFVSMLLVVAAKFVGDYAMEHYDAIAAGLGAVVVVMGLIVGIGWAAEQFVKGSRESLAALGIIELLALGAMAVILAAKKTAELVQNHWGQVLAGLTATIILLGIFGVIAATAGKLKDKLRPGLEAIGMVELVALGAMAVVYCAMKLHQAKEDAGIDWGDILIDIGALSLILVIFGGVAKMASKIQDSVKKGAIALALCEALMLGSIILTFLMIKLHQTKEDAGIDWWDLYGDFFAMEGMIAIIGVMAFAAGKLMTFISPGLIAMAAIEGLILGSILLSHLMVNFHKTKEEAGIGWDDLYTDFAAMAGMMAVFGILAGAMAVLIIPIALGMVAMVPLAGFIFLVVKTIGSLVKLSKAIDDAGGHEKIAELLSVSIPAILKNINSDNFSVDMSIITLGKLMVKYALIADLIGSVLTVAESISKIAQIVGVIDDSGRIRQILSVNKETGEIKYGEPVDLKNVVTAITGAIKTFVENSQYSFEEVNGMYNAARIFEILANVTDPISKFVDMLSGYTSGAEGELCKVTIDEKGEVKIGHPIQVADVAKTIASAVSTFVKELFSKENVEQWSEMMYGDRSWIDSMLGRTGKKGSAMKDVAGIFGVIVEPICKFIDMISELTTGGNDTLRRIYVDKDGKIKEGPEVDVLKTAGLIARIMSSFVTTIYNTDKLTNVDVNKVTNIEKLLKPVNEMIKSSLDLSDDKIDANLITTNANAIGYANGKLVLTIMPLLNPNIKNDVLSGKIGMLGSLIETIGSISNYSAEKINSNSKAITAFMTDVVDKQMNKSKPHVISFTKSVNGLNKSFKDLDKVLIKDEKKRLEALTNFEKKVKEIIENIKDGKDALDSFNQSVVNAQSYENRQTSYKNDSSISTTPFFEQYNGGGGQSGGDIQKNQSSANITSSTEVKTIKLEIHPPIGTSNNLVYLGGQTIDITINGSEAKGTSIIDVGKE